MALGLLIGLTGGDHSRIFGLAYLSMFLPAIAVRIVFRAMKEAPLTAWHRFPLRYLPVAVFLMPAVLHLAILPTMAFTNGGLQWQNWLKPQSDGLYHTRPSRGWGHIDNPRLGRTHRAQRAPWSRDRFVHGCFRRDWLAGIALARLMDRLGARRAVVAVAIIWALWHVPFELSGILHIDGVSPVKLAVVVPPGIVAAGLILGWLWLRTESVWLTAIAAALICWRQTIAIYG